EAGPVRPPPVGVPGRGACAATRLGRRGSVFRCRRRREGTVRLPVMTTGAPLDPIAEARRQWLRRWPEHAEHMAAITSVMRVQQILLGEVERALKPYGLTFASYEALVLLHFSRAGRLPLGKMGERLM